MKFSSTCIAVASAFLPQLISAHMRITDPAPYNGENNAPLEANGSNFPCMMTGAAPQMSAGKTYTAGQTGSFKVVGGATHGGGSCQVSITYDNPPTKNSKFKVVQSWIGGCPVASNTENMSNDRNDQSIPDFQFTMPEGLKSGDATFVWTWFNRIGNREMYMNCAPIKIEGNGDSDEVFDSLPDMFKANIGSEGSCTTTERQDIIFPDENIGKNVIVGKGQCDFQPACKGQGTYSFKPGQPGSQDGVSAPGGGSSNPGSGSGDKNGGGQYPGAPGNNQGTPGYTQPKRPTPTGRYSRPTQPALVDTGKNGGGQSNTPPSDQYNPINGGGNDGSSSPAPQEPKPSKPSMPSQPPSYGGSQGSQPSTPPPSTGGGSYTGGNDTQAPTEDDNTGMYYGKMCGDGNTPVVCSGAPQGKFIECYGKNPNGQNMGFVQTIPGGYNGCEDFAKKCGHGSPSQKFKRHAFEHAKRHSRRHFH